MSRHRIEALAEIWTAPGSTSGLGGSREAKSILQADDAWPAVVFVCGKGGRAQVTSIPRRHLIDEHIGTSLINPPREAKETNIGLTGGKSGHQIYLNGEKHHVLRDGDMIDHLVELCEKKQTELLNKKS